MTVETGELEKGLVIPRTLKGCQDLLPDQMIARNALVEKIRAVYEKYGFVPLDTPVLEYLTTLQGSGSEETNKQLFRMESPEREAIAMRFDLTVPFARLIAQYREELKLPFRRYHIGPVFRADKPGEGRYRQFTQFDIDAAGSDSVAVDAEIVAAMCQVLHSIGLCNQPDDRQFLVRVNNRKLDDALLSGCGISSRATQKHVLRVVDKLQKVGIDNVRKELGEGRIDDSGDPIRGVGLPADVITKILDFISITGDGRRSIVKSIGALLPASETTDAALREMSELADALDELGVAESDAAFDPSLARGLDYYSGPVYEANLLKAPEMGSIMGGGRYDQLVARFLDTAIPATGASIGLDRMVAALKSINKLQSPLTTTKVLVASAGKVPSTALLGVATELRKAGIPTEAYFGSGPVSLREQLSLANAREIPVAVIMGEDEIKTNKVSIKDLRAGAEQRAAIADREQYRKAGKQSQKTVDRSDMVATIKALLG